MHVVKFWRKPITLDGKEVTIRDLVSENDIERLLNTPPSNREYCVVRGMENCIPELTVFNNLDRLIHRLAVIINEWDLLDEDFETIKEKLKKVRRKDLQEYLINGLAEFMKRKAYVTTIVADDEGELAVLSNADVDDFKYDGFCSVLANVDRTEYVMECNIDKAYTTDHVFYAFLIAYWGEIYGRLVELLKNAGLPEDDAMFVADKLSSEIWDLVKSEYVMSLLLSTGDLELISKGIADFFNVDNLVELYERSGHLFGYGKRFDVSVIKHLADIGIPVGNLLSRLKKHILREKTEGGRRLILFKFETEGGSVAYDLYSYDESTNKLVMLDTAYVDFVGTDDLMKVLDDIVMNALDKGVDYFKKLAYFLYDVYSFDYGMNVDHLMMAIENNVFLNMNTVVEVDGATVAFLKNGEYVLAVKGDSVGLDRVHTFLYSDDVEYFIAEAPIEETLTEMRPETVEELIDTIMSDRNVVEKLPNETIQKLVEVYAEVKLS